MNIAACMARRSLFTIPGLEGVRAGKRDSQQILDFLYNSLHCITAELLQVVM